jgi:hypothetical protein
VARTRLPASAALYRGIGPGILWRIATIGVSGGPPGDAEAWHQIRRSARLVTATPHHPENDVRAAQRPAVPRRVLRAPPRNRRHSPSGGRARHGDVHQGSRGRRRRRGVAGARRPPARRGPGDVDPNRAARAAGHRRGRSPRDDAACDPRHSDRDGGARDAGHRRRPAPPPVAPAPLGGAARDGDGLALPREQRPRRGPPGRPDSLWGASVL